MKKKSCKSCGKVTVAKGIKVARGVEEKMRKKAGSGNAGSYKSVKKSDFVGAAGGSSPYSFPVDTLKRARAALSYSRNAPNPEALKAAVYRKWPELKKNRKK